MLTNKDIERDNIVHLARDLRFILETFEGFQRVCLADKLLKEVKNVKYGMNIWMDIVGRTGNFPVLKLMINSVIAVCDTMIEGGFFHHEAPNHVVCMTTIKQMLERVNGALYHLIHRVAPHDNLFQF